MNSSDPHSPVIAVHRLRNKSDSRSRILCNGLLSIVALAGIASPLSAQRYRAVVLHPPTAKESSALAAGDGEQVGYVEDAKGNQRAFLWRGSATANTQDLHPDPNSFVSSRATAVRNHVKVGYGSGPGTQWRNNAVRWDGANLPLITHPGRHEWSVASGIATGLSGEQVVGTGLRSGADFEFGLLWPFSSSPTDNSTVTNMIYTGSEQSEVLATDGNRQVGYSIRHVSERDRAYDPNAPSETKKAMRWEGTADNYNRLHPADYADDLSSESVAYGIRDGKIVGSGAAHGLPSHALLWEDVDSDVYYAIDLNPAGFQSSEALAVAGGRQAGYGIPQRTNGPRALVWAGSAGLYTDLQLLLPPGYVSSKALGMDEAGNIVGEAGFGNANTSHAVLWVAEPAQLNSIKAFPSSTLSPWNKLATLTIALDGMAPPTAGASIALTSSAPLAVRVPSSVTIASGGTSVSFLIQTNPQGILLTQSVRISATYAGVSKSIAIQVVK